MNRHIKILTLLIVTLLLWHSKPATCYANGAGHYLSNSDPDRQRPTLGLTLSGGGAKGLAHIGLLHIIDSLGIRIDLISGTSMGSIIGGLYAAGYSAAEIEEIAMKMDWDRTFGGRPNLDYVDVRSRLRSGTSIVELPVEEWRIKLRTGIIEGQYMWHALENLFFHLRTVDDFNKLHVPFACVATDVETGEAVIMRDGDIVSAVRASMAIPAVFTPASRDDRKLIDGGVVNNFPVDLAREMGADLVIGMNVSQGLRKAEDLKTPIDMLRQMGFYQNARVFDANKESTDIYIKPDLENFNASSFTFTAEIIELGKQAARESIPLLLALPEEVFIQPGELPERGRHATDEHYIILNSVRYEGLENVRGSYIDRLIYEERGDTMRLNDIRSIIDRLFATGYFDRVSYRPEALPGNDGRYDLVLSFYEKPLGSISAAIHYSTFTGAAIIVGGTYKKFLSYNLDAGIRVRLGEQPAIRLSLDYSIGAMRKSWLNANWIGERLRYTLYDDFDPVGGYRQSHNRAELSYNNLTGRLSYFSAGGAKWREGLKPTITLENSITGHTTGYEAFIKWSRDALDNQAYPYRGQSLSFGGSYFFGINESLDVLPVSAGLQPGDLGITPGNFLKFNLNWESYLPLSERVSSITHLQAGYSHNYTQGFINAFNIGGTSHYLRNQIRFAGLTEFSIVTPSVVAFSMGWRHRIISDLHYTARVSGALYDFDLQNLEAIEEGNFLLGAGISVGFLSILGPLDFTISWSPQKNRILGYLNFGWYF